MDLGDTLKGQAAPAAGPMPKENSNDMEMVQFSERGSFNLSIFLLWLCAIVAILGSVFLWFLSRSAADELADKQSRLDEVTSKLSTPANTEAEARAKSLISAVTQLKTASANRYLMKDFLPLFYTRINKNVVVSNLTIGSDGKISLDGKTDSYKSAAEQALSLRDWKINSKSMFTSVQLGTVSESIASGTEVTFSLSGQIDKTVKLTTTTTTGGSNAEVQ
jgi:hypothetical protein